MCSLNQRKGVSRYNPGFITKRVLPAPNMNPADTESMWFLILGEFPNAYVANTNEHEDILLIDDRHHTDPLRPADI